MRLFSPPKILKIFFPKMIWDKPQGQKRIFLTFDDGPHPTITPKVINLLSNFNARATFFCVGNNIKKYPSTFEMLQKANHLVGNHTFNHNDGFSSTDENFYSEIEETENLTNTGFFRPPHGKIKPRQIRHLSKKYKIIAWSVIAYDWDKTLSPEKIFEKILRNARDGSIIAFHDNEKAEKNMLAVLPQVLEHFSKLGYHFCRLDE